MMTMISLSTIARSQQAQGSKVAELQVKTSAQSDKLSIEDTVKYINKLLDSGLGAKDEYYSTGHIIADRSTRTITWSRVMSVCIDVTFACWRRPEYAFFRASADDIAEISAGNDPNTVPEYRENGKREPDVVLGCSDEGPCFQKWTYLSQTLGFEANFETLARWTDLEFKGKDTEVQIFTTGEDEMTARAVKALKYLIAQLQALPTSDTTGPFAK